MDDQDQIDSHVYGKIHARKRLPATPENHEDEQFYMRGYNAEKKRMESPSYCRIYGIPIRVISCFSALGGVMFSGDID